MKQKIVIKVDMACERSRSRAMALAARADGVTSMAITGDAREKLEVVGVDVDTVRLVGCLRRKVGRAEILQVEEVKAKKPEDTEKKKPEEPAMVVHPPPQCYPGGGGYYYCHHPSPQIVVCEETSSCRIM